MNPAAAPAVVKVGQVVDLAVRFGNQVRHKCVFCSHYLSAKHQDVACSCGAAYVQNDGKFEVVTLPT